MLEVEKTFDFLISEWLRYKSIGWNKMANLCFTAAQAHYERYMKTQA